VTISARPHDQQVQQQLRLYLAVAFDFIVVPFHQTHYKVS